MRSSEIHDRPDGEIKTKGSVDRIEQYDQRGLLCFVAGVKESN